MYESISREIKLSQIWIVIYKANNSPYNIMFKLDNYIPSKQTFSLNRIINHRKEMTPQRTIKEQSFQLSSIEKKSYIT